MVYWLEAKKYIAGRRVGCSTSKNIGIKHRHEEVESESVYTYHEAIAIIELRGHEIHVFNMLRKNCSSGATLIH